MASSMDTYDAEDTAFYAQLTRQILCLMDEEDDETYARRSSTERRRPVTGDGSSISSKQFGWLESGRSLEVPSWMESLWSSNGGGTGVFIPRVVATAKPGRRRHRRSRKNNGGGKMPTSTQQMIHG